MKEQKGVSEGFIEVVLAKVLINRVGRNKIWIRNRTWVLSIIRTAKSPYADLNYPDEMIDNKKKMTETIKEQVCNNCESEYIYTIEIKDRILEAICRE